MDIPKKVAAMLKTTKRRITFTLEAPTAKKVALVGDFNAWDPKKHPMENKKNGPWKKAVMLSPGRYEYRFLVDGIWRNDSANPLTCGNCFGSVNNVKFVQ